MTKYHARKVTIDGITFDSQAEWRRYSELVLLQKAGEISVLQVHPPFPLEVKGKLVGKYIADFSYVVQGVGLIIEDVKGVRTPVYRLKKKLVAALYGVEIIEVSA